MSKLNIDDLLKVPDDLRRADYTDTLKLMIEEGASDKNHMFAAFLAVDLFHQIKEPAEKSLADFKREMNQEQMVLGYLHLAGALRLLSNSVINFAVRSASFPPEESIAYISQELFKIDQYTHGVYEALWGETEKDKG